MKVALILSVILIGAFCATHFEKAALNDLFTQWKLTNNKHYKAGHEEEHRFNIFVHNYIKIQKHNLQHKGVTLGLNQFADLTLEEFTDLHTGLIPRKSNGQVFNANTNDLPANVDWRQKGAVTPIKNQGACGSCWAFSAIGALEGQYFINNNKLVSFSEQNFVDCVTKAHGCQGGWMSLAFEYTAENGVETGDSYPYTARTGKCAFESDKAVKINKGYVNVTAKSASALKAAIVINPVSVAIMASQTVFQFYKSGVIQTGCGDSLNHGVLAVGYDTYSGVEAFIVKNSWGTIWGNAGYVLIGTDESQNNGNGVCGILKNACFPN
jgi:C1A family cysteine protease